MKPTIHPKDAGFAGVEGTNPRQLGKKRKVTWQQKVMGAMVKGEDGIYRPAPEKEAQIQAFANRYGALLGLLRLRVPDALLRALFARGGLLDRLVESSHKSFREEFRREAAILRSIVKAELGSLPDDVFLDPRRQPDGSHRALVMELKTKAGTLSKGQRIVSQIIGGFHVPRSSDEVKTLLDEFTGRKGKPSP